MQTTRSRRAAAKPRMTAGEATAFDGVSMASALQVQGAIAARAETGQYPECSCSPYTSVYTFGRWIAQGFAPRKGERALRIGSWVPVGTRTVTDAETGERSDVPAFLKPHTLCLFCRCQVEARP